MAALNIDKSLIDQSALVQSDEVIAMQNGCFCCTLQSDLVDQIISLTEKKIFNYMLIEASGVSEPSQIGPLFDLCDDEHDPNDPDADHDHDGKPQLGEVARLDTCVTVVDSAEFYINLGSMKTYEQADTVGTIAELMMEQVEFSNVVILNKGDLVSEKQTEDIVSKIELINPKARIDKSVQSKVDVMEILNTHLYKPTQNKEEFWMTSGAEEKIEAEILECCEKTMSNEGKKCCKSKSKDGSLVDTLLSQVQLDVIANTIATVRKETRHEKRFGITSFIYRARRPFHPGRLYDRFLEPYFIFHGSRKEEIEETAKLEILQKDAASKQTKRLKQLGGLMRSKGFVWIATSQFFMGAWQQAGNVLRIKPARPWLCEVRHMWEGSPSEETIMKELTQENVEEWPFGDRCQELVFIGKDLKHEFIQNLLDQCLLTDEEMDLGPRKWQEMWYDSVDRIRLPTKLFIDLQDDYDNAVIKVQAMDDFEDMANMTVTEVFEDQDYDNA